MLHRNCNYHAAKKILQIAHVYSNFYDFQLTQSPKFWTRFSFIKIQTFAKYSDINNNISKTL